MRIPCLLALTLASCLQLRADPAIANVYARNPLNLDGKWAYIIDPYETGYFDYRRQPYDEAKAPSGGFFLDQHARDKTELIEYNFDLSPTLMVPGDWNSQEEKLLYYEGTIWYRRLFTFHPKNEGKRVFLYFGAANYRADVYLNGRKLGTHIGGFTPFSYEVTTLVKDGANSLVVRVDNRREQDAVPTVNTDWWNYGGITRDVLLVETPQTYISGFQVSLAPGTSDRIVANVQLDGPQKQQKITIKIPELGVAAETTTAADGTAKLDVAAPSLRLWSPEQPQLYAVTLATESDRTTDRIGFRTIQTRGADILLNGKSVFLRGICIHEENPQRGGRAYSEEDARLLLGWAKELGCNFVRLAHYPHNEHMARVADQLGLMLWEEVPVYWTISWTNPTTLANAKNQLTDLVVRDRNRASVVVWSVANETPVSDARTHFLRQLVETVRGLDSTRLVSAAMEVHTDPANKNHKIVDDPFSEFTDLVSFNEYVGWYDGLPDKAGQVQWTIKYNKPVFISEFGADALQGWHADALTRFSEEYQADVYRQTFAMLSKIPQWRGVTPWILCDFRSPRRQLPNVQDGWNRKGLIGQNGVKKMAFGVVKEFYETKVAEK